MLIRLGLIISFLVFSQTEATTFRAVSLSEQLTATDKIINGVLTEKFSQYQDGKIVTKFKIENSQSKKISVVVFPGGQVGDNVRKIEGVPTAKIGDKLVILTKEVESQNWVLNLGLGKFKVIHAGGREILVNQIFPNEPKVSQVSMPDFLKMAREINPKLIEGSESKNNQTRDAEATLLSPTAKTRETASIHKSKVSKQKYALDFWLIALGILLSIFSTCLLLIKKRKS